MNKKHTPGPWEAVIYKKSCGNIRGMVVRNDQAGSFVDEIPIAFISELKTGTNEATANARLITAAPDLLAMLRRITLSCILEGTPYEDRAIELINKAGGRS